MRFTREMIVGALMVAGAMYFLDPGLGRRRRARIEDQVRRIGREATNGFEMGLRDLQNRGRGLVHDAEARLHAGPHKRGTISKRGRFRWSPGPRLVAAAGGAALMANCAMRRTPSAMFLGTLGFGVCMRAIGCRREAPIQRTMLINAPVEQVFEFFANPENYLRISDAVTNVELLGRGRFAKTMLIGGLPMRFEERLTCIIKNERIESEATKASPIHYTKQLVFETTSEHTTRLHMRFCYSPPGGDLGHNIAAIFGIDAATILDDLLMRAKAFLETGHAPHDATASRQAQRHLHDGNAAREKAGPMLGSAAPDADRLSPSHPSPRSTPWLPAAGAANIHGPERFPPIVD